MAQVIARVVQQKDVAVIDVTYDDIADVGGPVPHGIASGLGSTGVAPEVVLLGAPPITVGAAVFRAADIIIRSVDTTTVILDKVAGAGTAPITVRLSIARKGKQLSAFNTAFMGALVGAMEGGGE